MAEPEAVVLVHGLWTHGMVMWLMARRIARCGYRTACWSYPSMRSTLTENAQSLARYCASLDAHRVHFVGHSMGGLVVLRMLESPQKFPAGRVVLTGTPYGGSYAARRLARLMARREQTVAAAVAGTVFLFACGSSAVAELHRIGGPGRWAALVVLLFVRFLGRRVLGGLRRRQVVDGAALQMREARVARDAEHPRHELAVVLERRFVFQHLHEHVLYEILGRRAIARHTQAIAVDPRVMALEQRREGHGAAAADLPHQL